MIVTVTPNPSIDRTVTLTGPLTRGAVHRVSSVTSEPTRCTAPRVNGELRVTVRSMLGLGVTVTIMRPPPRRRSRSTARDRRR